MAEDTGTPEAGEDAGSGETTEAQGTEQTTEEPFDRDRALATIRTQRESEEAAKERAKTLEQELRELKRSGLSDDAKIAEDLKEAQRQRDAIHQERDALQGEIDAIRRQGRVTAVANRYEAHDPEDIALILSEEDTEDDRALDRAVKALKRSKPHLFRAERASGGQITPGSGEAGSDMNDFIRSRGRG